MPERLPAFKPTRCTRIRLPQKDSIRATLATFTVYDSNGVVLLESGKKITIPTLERFLEACRRLLEEANAIESSFLEVVSEPQGRLTVSVPAAFGRACLIWKDYLCELNL